jgi:hypothetical protein
MLIEPARALKLRACFHGPRFPLAARDFGRVAPRRFYE